MTEERKLRPVFKMSSRDRGQVNEFICPVGPRLSRPDQGDLVLSSLGDLLRNRLEYDFGATAKAMETGEGKKKVHLAVVDPDTKNAEELPNSITDQREGITPMRWLAVHYARERPQQRSPQ